jgi:hypothetical protein
MILRALTNGAITVASAVTVSTRIVGGLLITADGTNNAVLKVRRDDTNGKPVIDITTKIPLWITGPIDMEGTNTAYVDISGTGAAVQVYEWVS